MPSHLIELGYKINSTGLGLSLPVVSCLILLYLNELESGVSGLAKKDGNFSGSSYAFVILESRIYCLDGLF